jgi:hypothetical protein
MLILGLAASLGACASGSADPDEFLDQRTAATVTAVSRPWVFSHERPELAAHSRDYITLTAVAVDHGGTIACYILSYTWSTVDRRGSADLDSAAPGLTIAADDRRLQPTLVGDSIADAGIGRAVGAPPGHRWKLRVYSSDLPTLHFLSEARHVAVMTAAPDAPIVYEAWKDGRNSLRKWVARLEGS